MNKKTTLFILITLTAILILLTSTNATSINDTDNNGIEKVSEKTTTAEPVVKEKIENSQTKQKTQTKQITKTNKTQENKKTSTKTVEVNNYDEITSIMNSIDSDDENDEYIINLNEGIYQLPNKATTKYTVNSQKNIIINANNQNFISTKTSYQLQLVIHGNLTINNAIINHTITNNGGNLILNNSVINYRLRNINNANLMINNCYLNCTLENTGFIIIDDLTTLGKDFNITANTNTDNIITNNSYFKPEEIPNLNNTNITTEITIPTTGNTTFTNCQINAKITNKGNLTLQNCTLSNNYLTSSSYTNGFLLENHGNLTIINCVVENNSFEITATSTSRASGVIVNQKNAILSLNNTRFNNNNNTGNDDNYLIYNVGVIRCFNNCSFTNNNMKSYVTKGYGAYQDYVSPDEFDLNVSDLWYENNTEPFSASYIILITNSKFINNSRVDNRYYATNSGALTGSNLRVINTTFIKNGITLTDATAYSGGSGGAISGTYLTVMNCTFDSNYAINPSTWLSYQGGGAISTSGRSIITESTFKNNYVISPEGVVQPEEWGGRKEPGMGGAIRSLDGNITITQNQFINNSASINGSAIYLYGGINQITITNNTFENNKEATETIYIKDYNTTNNIQDNTYTNTSIGFKTLTLNGPNKAYTGDQITINLDIELEHPEFYDEDILEQTQYSWYINGETNTNKETQKTLNVENNNIITYVKPTITNSRTNIYSLTPTILNDIIITSENINQYLILGELIVSPNSKLIFQGEFTDIGEINNKKNEVFFDGTQATFTNTYFTIEANNNTIQNMNIKNTNTNPYTIKISGDDNTITNNTITTTNNQGLTAAIYNNNHNNNKITYNTLIVSGPALSTTSQSGATISNTQAILSIGGQNNQINYNNITVTNTTNPELAEFSTIEAITAPKGTNNTISYNNIQCNGARFNYGINLLNNIQENEISYNNITVTGYRYVDGIQVGDGANNNIITYNNLNITCLNTTPVDEAAITYGIIITSQGGQTSNNNTITQNNIQLKGIVNYGIEIYTATNTTITTNNITLTGAKSTGIGYAHSPNSTVTQNTINTNDDSSIPINSVTEELQPDNTGIRIQQDSDNILIEDNTIQTYDKQGKDTCIDVESSNVTIKDNNLTSSTKTGDNTITTTQPDTTIQDNNAIQQNSTTQTTTEDLTIGDSTTLTAQFYDDTYTPAGDGKAIFKVNGKTLRDNQGNVIYADVINGRAELPDVNITQEWTKEDTTIQAIYIGDDNNNPITTTPTTINVTKPEATIILDAPTEATAGTTITLKATVTDGDNTISSGRVAFKLNGKTLKDPKTGKALYAEVKDGIATITYTIPEKTKAKEYTLTAVFTDTEYDRVEAETILNVVKA